GELHHHQLRPERGEIAERTHRDIELVPERARVLRFDDVRPRAEAGEQSLRRGGPLLGPRFAPVERDRLQLFLVDVAERELQLQRERRVAAGGALARLAASRRRQALQGIGRDAQRLRKLPGERRILQRVLQRGGAERGGSLDGFLQQVLLNRRLQARLEEVLEDAVLDPSDRFVHLVAQRRVVGEVQDL